MLIELPLANEFAPVAVTVAVGDGVLPVQVTGWVRVTVEVAVVSAVMPLVVSGDAGSVAML
jgi:hypothetical protein